jgi:hypothetical protein
MRAIRSPVSGSTTLSTLVPPYRGAELNVVNAVRDLYRARWGWASWQGTFRMAGLEIEICKWDAATNGEGVDLYATLGASAEDMPHAMAGHRVEYFVRLQPGRDDVASPLAALGLYARRGGETIDHGHAVVAGGPLWPGTEMNAFLVLRQVAEILPSLTLPNGIHVEFLQGVPLFDSERRFKASRGAEALLQRWGKAGTPFWDPGRQAEPPA